MDPISDQFPHVTTYNYAENEPIANIDLHGLQKYRPKMQPIESPRDLFSTKMLNNLWEGSKTAVFELVDVLQINAPGPEKRSDVEGGYAGSAENGRSNETRVNAEAEIIELDEFTSGMGPKYPVGQAGAYTRAGVKLGKAMLEELGVLGENSQVKPDTFVICTGGCGDTISLGENGNYHLEGKNADEFIKLLQSQFDTLITTKIDDKDKNEKKKE